MVATDQHLVGEALCAALASRDLPTTLLPGWPALARVPRPRTAEREGWSSVLLIACALTPSTRLAEAVEVGRTQSLPWLVLATGGGPAAWGGLLEAGARRVVSSGVSLDDLVGTVTDMQQGRPLMTDEDRSTLIEAWQAEQAASARAAASIVPLDRAERELLEMVRSGTTVAVIAERFGISQAAVLVQVRALLRHLSGAAHP